MKIVEKENYFRSYVFNAVNTSISLMSIYKTVQKVSVNHHRDPLIFRYDQDNSEVITSPGAVSDDLGYHLATCSIKFQFQNTLHTLNSRAETPDFPVPLWVDSPYNTGSISGWMCKDGAPDSGGITYQMILHRPTSASKFF